MIESQVTLRERVLDVSVPLDRLGDRDAAAIATIKVPVGDTVASSLEDFQVGRIVGSVGLLKGKRSVGARRTNAEPLTGRKKRGLMPRIFCKAVSTCVEDER